MVYKSSQIDTVKLRPKENSPNRDPSLFLINFDHSITYIPMNFLRNNSSNPGG